jgi:hypothetical protein
MKFKALPQATAVAVLGLMLTACGGGGSGGGDGGGTPAAGLQVSGTAATGAALASASVEVKCASGNGTATTSSAGAYSLSITGGALPCIVRVAGTTAGGASVTLHSVVETGTSGSGGTTAVANVTPVTEMIVAQLVAALPSEAFANFTPSQVTAAGVSTATAAIVDALKAAGVDLTGTDPLKATLVPATATTAGNAYDQLLDALGEKVPPEGLPQVVNQIASAAATESGSGLTEAMTAVAGGALEGCPNVVSGRYRTLDLFGKSIVRDIDFAKKTFTAANGTDQLAISTDAAKPCEFTVTGTSEGKAIEWNIAMGANGAGAYKARFTSPASTGTDGFIFPVQSRAVSDLAGEWSFLQSGAFPGEGLVHFSGKVTVNADGSATACDYAPDWQSCVEPAAMSVVARSDGGFDLVDGGEVAAQLYGYKAPNGTMVVFGTSNAAGTDAPDVEQTSLVISKLSPLALPAVGSTVRYWDVSLTQNQSTRTVAAPFAESNTVQSVDTAAGTATRQRASDGRIDTVSFNQPLPGVRVREAGSFNGVPFGEAIQVPLGIGLTLSVNSVPYPTGVYFHNISVERP